MGERYFKIIARLTTKGRTNRRPKTKTDSENSSLELTIAGGLLYRSSGDMPYRPDATGQTDLP